jgi:hypothetical protein
MLHSINNLITFPNGLCSLVHLAGGQVFLVVASTISLCFTPAGQKGITQWCSCAGLAVSQKPLFVEQVYSLYMLLPSS